VREHADLEFSSPQPAVVCIERVHEDLCPVYSRLAPVPRDLIQATTLTTTQAAPASTKTMFRSSMIKSWLPATGEPGRTDQTPPR
jgi:hypothetical protein